MFPFLLSLDIRFSNVHDEVDGYFDQTFHAVQRQWVYPESSDRSCGVDVEHGSLDVLKLPRGAMS